MRGSVVQSCGSACSGTTTTTGFLYCADIPANARPVFPAEAITGILLPNSVRRCMVGRASSSLNEPVAREAWCSGEYPENETKSRGSPSSRESPAAANVTGPPDGSNGRVTGSQQRYRKIPLYGARCSLRRQYSVRSRESWPEGQDRAVISGMISPRRSTGAGISVSWNTL